MYRQNVERYLQAMYTVRIHLSCSYVIFMLHSQADTVVGKHGSVRLNMKCNVCKQSAHPELCSVYRCDNVPVI